MPTMSQTAAAETRSVVASSREAIIERLVGRFGEAHRKRLAAGLACVAERWSAVDGDDAALESFCVEHFVADPEARRRLIDRLETAMERIGGHLYEMRRALRWWSDV